MLAQPAAPTIVLVIMINQPRQVVARGSRLFFVSRTRGERSVVNNVIINNH